MNLRLVECLRLAGSTEAADLIEFFLSQMQNSPHMNGQHQWRFRSGGWPMTHCVGPTALEAAMNAVNEIRNQRDKEQR